MTTVTGAGLDERRERALADEVPSAEAPLDGARPDHDPIGPGSPPPEPLVLSPARAGRHVAVRPVVPSDHQWLYEMAVMTDRGAHWRLHGSVPPFDRFVQLLYGNCTAVFALERLSDHAPFGLCQLFDHEPSSHTAQLTAMIAGDLERKAWPLEGIFLFLDYAFTAFSLRKIYFESFEDEARKYRSAVGKLLTLEGRLTEHRLVFGRYVDMYIFAMRREDFLARRHHYLPVVRPLAPMP